MPRVRNGVHLPRSGRSHGSILCKLQLVGVCGALSLDGFANAYGPTPTIRDTLMLLAIEVALRLPGPWLEDQQPCGPRRTTLQCNI